MSKPLIGVVPLYDKRKDTYWMLPGYMKGIEDAGGIPIMLPMTADVESISIMATKFDGFLFTGGQDVNPELYGEQVESICGELCHERDVLEKLLFQYVIEFDKPIFGICRGLQLFNALLGGTLYQDIPTQLKADNMVEHTQRPPYSKPIHTVYIEKGNPLYRMINAEELAVNSYHHQGIKKLSDQLTAVAQAKDGLIEAVVMTEKKFVLAVQWHPEFSYAVDDYSFKLFLEFIKACDGNSSTRI